MLGPPVSTTTAARLTAWPPTRPLRSCGGAWPIWPRARRIWSWSTSRICGGSTSRRTARAPGPKRQLAPPGVAHCQRRGGTAGPWGSCESWTRCAGPSRRSGWSPAMSGARRQAPKRRARHLRGRPLFVQRGNPPAHGREARGAHLTRGRRHLRGLGPQRHAGRRHRATSTTGTPRLTCSGAGGLGDLGGHGAHAGPGHVYKFAITTRSGAVLEKADPFARCTESPPRTGSVVWDLAYEWGDPPGCGPGALAWPRRADLGLRSTPGQLAP